METKTIDSDTQRAGLNTSPDTRDTEGEGFAASVPVSESAEVDSTDALAAILASIASVKVDQPEVTRVVIPPTVKERQVAQAIIDLARRTLALAWPQVDGKDTRTAPRLAFPFASLGIVDDAGAARIVTVIGTMADEFTRKANASGVWRKVTYVASDATLTKKDAFGTTIELPDPDAGHVLIALSRVK